MDNPEHFAKLKEGFKVWNRWRRENPEIQPNLRGLRATGRNLSFLDLSMADLSGARLNRVNLFSANLTGANLRQAYIQDTRLRSVNFSGADLTGALLGGAHFVRSNLSGLKMTGARIETTVFADVDLSQVQGLSEVKHGGPSEISTSTLYRSGHLPPEFLRGCGVPKDLIDYLPSLLNAGAIQFYSCFISYSTKDQAFAERLHADLQNKGVRCWFAPHDMRGGKKIHTQIDEAIRVYDRLLLILSEDSMASEWVKTEIAHARQKELAQKGQVLFPVRLVDFEELRQWKCPDGHTGKDSAREIREYFIPDFSNWKDHDSYQQAFERLLKDLKAEENRA